MPSPQQQIPYHIIPEIDLDRPFNLKSFRDELSSNIKILRSTPHIDAASNGVVRGVMQISERSSESLSNKELGRKVIDLLHRICPNNLIKIAIRRKLDLNLCEILGNDESDLISRHDVANFVSRLSEALICRSFGGQNYRPSEELFERGVRVLQLLHKSGTNDRFENLSNNDAIISPEKSRAMFYSALKRSFYCFEIPSKCEVFLSGVIERAKIEHQDYLLRIGQSEDRLTATTMESELEALMRAKFLSHYTGSKSILIETMQRTPAFGLYLAASGSVSDSSEYAQATASAIKAVLNRLFDMIGEGIPFGGTLFRSYENHYAAQLNVQFIFENRNIVPPPSLFPIVKPVGQGNSLEDIFCYIATRCSGYSGEEEINSRRFLQSFRSIQRILTEEGQPFLRDGITKFLKNATKREVSAVWGLFKGHENAYAMSKGILINSYNSTSGLLYNLLESGASKIDIINFITDTRSFYDVLSWYLKNRNRSESFIFKNRSDNKLIELRNGKIALMYS